MGLRGLAEEAQDDDDQVQHYADSRKRSGRSFHLVIFHGGSVGALPGAA
jgi:hypothetical protein